MNTLFIGTYSRRGSVGIYTALFEKGKLSLTEAAEAGNPSFLAVHPNSRFLYAVNENPEGGVTAFEITETSGLKELNSSPTGGSSPCHLAVDPSGTCLIVVNYGTGSIRRYPITHDGSLGQAGELIQHEGSGPNEVRQKGPHAHSVTIDEEGKFAYVCDLGLDRVVIYRLDNAEGCLRFEKSVSVHPGAGPRHFAFSPDGQFAYVINELDSTITVLRRDPDTEILVVEQTLSTLPDEFTGESHCADVHVHPSGRFLYGSNRGHDSLALFTVNGHSGELTFAGTYSTQGRKPRNFAIDPSGQYLLAANMDTDTIVVFKIDESSGRLNPTGETLDVPSPVCLLFHSTVY